jgi:hypothetical protein
VANFEFRITEVETIARVRPMGGLVVLEQNEMKHNVWSCGPWVRCFVGMSALLMVLGGPVNGENAAQAGGDAEELLGQECTDLTDCQITTPADCLWKPYHDNAADCSLLVGPTYDAVDRRMCELGLLMDGDLSPALGERLLRIP